MEFLRKTWLQARALRERLTPTQSFLILAVVIIMILLIMVILPYATSQEMVAMPQFARSEAEALQRLETRGIKAEVRSGHIWVSKDKQIEAIAVLQQSDLMSADTSAAFDQLISQQSPWMTNTQNRQAFNLALRKTLGQIIAKMNNVKSADVFLSVPEKKGFGETHVRPTASVNVVMKSRHNVNKRLTEAIAGLVSGAVAEMQPRDVVVVDANNGQQFTIGNEDEMAPGESMELLVAQENRYRRKIEQVLNYIPGVKIAVNVKADAVMRKDIQEFEYGKTEPLLMQESKEIERKSTSEAGAAGVRPNTQLTIPGSAQNGMEETITESRSEFGAKNLTKKTQAREVGHTTQKVSVTVNIPRSYFIGMLMQNGDQTEKPTPEQIEEAAQKELPRIEAQVEPLIDAEDKGVVRAHMIPDPEVLIAMLGGGPQEPSGLLAMLQSPLAKPLGMGLLAAFSLALMGYMVRKSLQQPPLPSVEELAGVPPPLPTEDDLIGEVAEDEGAMAGVEVDEEEIRARKIAEQISEMVKANPEEAGSLFNRWVEADD